MSLSKRLVFLMTISTLALASCGGAEDGSTTTTAATATGGVVTTAPASTNPEPTTETTTETTTTDTTAVTTTTAAAASGNGPIELVLEDGRSWTFEGVCTYTPDNTGPASALWNIDGVAADGSTFIAIMAFPFDPAKTTPVLIGNVVDAEENIFVLIESEDVSEGSKLILNLGLHDSIFRTVGDPIDLTATATCDL